MPRVVHFEITADDPERAVAFYEDLFTWDIDRWEGPVDYWLVTTGPAEEEGINGAIKRRVGDLPDEDAGMRAYVCTVEVDDIDAYLKRVEEYDGAVVMKKTEIPGVGWHAYCRDTEGNVFGLMESRGS